jgi:hypothetical protein
MPAATGAYRKALEQARARSYALRVESLRRIDRALQDHIDSLAAAIKALPPGDGARKAAALASRLVAVHAEERLALAIEAAVAQGRSASFDDVLAIQRQATDEVAAQAGVPGSLLGQVRAPGLTMAGVWESLGTGAATWRSLTRSYVKAAVADAQYVTTRALVDGVSADELARRLRPYLQGSEPFRKAFGPGPLTDKMLADPHFTKAAGQLRYNADRIAHSEIHNARGEAELQAFAEDPFVKAVRWQLSPNRGAQRKRDACDGLAKTDFFGMGKGVYPVAQVPTFPHPFCRCERVPVWRGVKDMHAPKPNPPRLHQPDIQGTGCGH